jgi:hypothetical protein
VFGKNSWNYSIVMLRKVAASRKLVFTLDSATNALNDGISRKMGEIPRTFMRSQFNGQDCADFYLQSAQQ